MAGWRLVENLSDIVDTALIGRMANLVAHPSDLLLDVLL